RGILNLALVEQRSALRQTLAMNPLPRPLAFFVLLFSGCVNRHQQVVIDYLLEENRVLRAVNGSRRLRLTDDQRRRLAVKGHVLGRRHLAAVAGIVTPDTTCGGTGGSSPRNTTVRGRGAQVARPPSRTSQRSSCAWRTRIRRRATCTDILEFRARVLVIIGRRGAAPSR